MGEGLLMTVCQHQPMPKMGNRYSVCRSHSIHPHLHPLSLLLLPLKLSKGYGREVILPTRTCLGKLARWRILGPTLHRVPFICHGSGQQQTSLARSASSTLQLQKWASPVSLLVQVSQACDRCMNTFFQINRHELNVFKMRIHDLQLCHASH